MRTQQRPCQMAAVRAAGPRLGSPSDQTAGLAGPRALMGSDLGKPGNRTECPPRAVLKADRMSGEARLVSLEQALCRAAVDRMFLAEWHVHLPRSAWPGAACTVGFAVVGCLESQFTLCKLVSLLGAAGQGAGTESES